MKSAYKLIAAIAVAISSMAMAQAVAAPTMKQTQNYIIEKTETSWKKNRHGLLFLQSVSFPSDCEMLIKRRVELKKKPGEDLVDEFARIQINEIYKLVKSGRGLSVRTKGKTISRVNLIYPAERKHKKVCKIATEPCEGHTWTRDSEYLQVISPDDLYAEKVGKAIFRMRELCGADKDELF